MWKVVTNSNLNPPLNYFFTYQYQLITIYYLRFIVKILWQHFLIAISYFSFLNFFHMFFFSLGFFSTTHISHSYLYLSFFFFFQFILDHFFSYLSLSLFLSLALSLFFLLFLFLPDSRTLSPSISHKQILSHTHIDHWQRSGNWRSTQIGILHFCFCFFGLISFILLFRFLQAYEKDCVCVSNLLIVFCVFVLIVVCFSL